MSPFNHLRTLIESGDVAGEEADRLARKCSGRLPAAERAGAHERLDFALVGIELALSMDTDDRIQKSEARDILDAIEARAMRPT